MLLPRGFTSAFVRAIFSSLSMNAAKRSNSLGSSNAAATRSRTACEPQILFTAVISAVSLVAFTLSTKDRATPMRKKSRSDGDSLAISAAVSSASPRSTRLPRSMASIARDGPAKASRACP